MYRNKNSNNLSKSKRMYLFTVILSLFLIISVTKLIDYQIINVNHYKKLTEKENKNILKQVVPAARGDIIDRNGIVLATCDLSLDLIIDSTFPMKTVKDNAKTAKIKNKQGNAILYNLIKILEKNNIKRESSFPINVDYPYNFIKDKELEATKLKKALNQQPYATSTDILNLLVEKYDIEGYNKNDAAKIAALRADMLVSEFQNSKIFKIIESIDSKYVEEFIGTKNNLQGVSIIETSNRYYPCNDVAAHIIGNTGFIDAEKMEEFKNKNYKANAIVGKYGIEKAFENYLRPIDGLLSIEKYKNGKIKKTYYEQGEQPEPGKTVRLTIDKELTERVQSALEEYVNKTSSSKKGAAVVIMDPNNGEILSMVSLPSYNLNTYYEEYSKLASAYNKPLINQALSTFRPGSIFKIFVASTALLTGAITPNTTFRCCPGKVLFKNMSCYQLRHKNQNKNMTLLEAIKNSCNNYFYATAKATTIEKIDEYAPYFGLATDTGLEIYNPDGRVTNPIRYLKLKIPYQQGFTWQTGIGQADVYLTPLQWSIMTMVIANYGKRYSANIVKSIESFDGKTIYHQNKPKVISQLDSSNIAWPTVLKGMKLMAETKTHLPKQKNLIFAKSGTPEYSDANKNLVNSTGVIIHCDKNKKPDFVASIIVRNGAHAEEFLINEVSSIWEKLKEERNESTQNR